jgi:hypothetical protein
MQEFSVAFGRVSRATFSTNPELKSYVSDLMNRAYSNLHGVPLTMADPQWSSAVVAAAVQLCLDERVQALSTRELLQLFENVIRISEEHLREAKRHAAMASNVFYLKETALDAILIEQAQPLPGTPAAPTVVGIKMAHVGRVVVTRNEEEVA